MTASARFASSFPMAAVAAAFLALIAHGPGRWSLDHVLQTRRVPA